MTDLKPYLQKWEKHLEKFLGFNIKIDAEKNDIKNVEIEVELPNVLLQTETATLSNLMDRIVYTLKNKDLTEVEFYQYDSIIEEIALNFIKVSGKNKIKENMYDFLENVRDLSQKTYEKAPSQLSFIMEDEKTLSFIKESKMEIIYFEEKMSVETLILKDKKSLKLIDGLSLSLLLDKNYKVTGMVRKSAGEKDIRSIILEEREFEKILLKKIILKSFLENGSKKVKKDRLEEITTQMTDLALEVIERTKFIEIHNQSINWYMTPSVYITSKNGKWSYKNFYILKGFLLEQLYINNQENEKLLDETSLEEIIEKTSFFVEALKNLSDNNIGALLVFLDNNNTIDEVTSSTNNLFNDVIKENGVHQNIQSCDKFVFQLISSVDGATFIDKNYNILDFGRLIDTPPLELESHYDKEKESIVEQGARTAAAKKVSRYGLAIKISEDGGIGVYKDGDIKLRI